MEINLTMQDFNRIRKWMDSEIRRAKRYIENNQDKKDESAKSYYSENERKIKELEPILEEINNQYCNTEVKISMN